MLALQGWKSKTNLYFLTAAFNKFLDMFCCSLNWLPWTAAHVPLNLRNHPGIASEKLHLLHNTSLVNIMQNTMVSERGGGGWVGVAAGEKIKRTIYIPGPCNTVLIGFPGLRRWLRRRTSVRWLHTSSAVHRER